MEGDLHLIGSVNIGDMPVTADDNYVDGAKIWLVQSSDYDALNEEMIAWNPTEYLFEYDLITFNGVDVS